MFNSLLLRSDPAQAAKTQKQRECLHEHWKSCHDYPEAHTWESRAEEDIKEEEAVRALVAAEDDSYLAYDEACRVRQFVAGLTPRNRYLSLLVVFRTQLSSANSMASSNVP
ncbi:hypothetical protein EI94DRAFT_1805100 [Lactarius quietus]|nr:hypothetical protein EI94DRAFT_1805100 [Lactarius quietus]